MDRESLVWFWAWGGGGDDGQTARRRQPMRRGRQNKGSHSVDWAVRRAARTLRAVGSEIGFGRADSIHLWAPREGRLAIAAIAAIRRSGERLAQAGPGRPSANRAQPPPSWAGGWLAPAHICGRQRASLWPVTGKLCRGPSRRGSPDGGGRRASLAPLPGLFVLGPRQQEDSAGITSESI